MSGRGFPPPPLTGLPRLRDRLSFLYVERCVIHRDNNALTFSDDAGVVHVPVTAVAAVMLGPGTSISHKAMSMIGESGGTALWTGENGVRLYASGRGLNRSNRLLRVQARLSTNKRERLDVARAMYAMRFPGEDVSGLTMQQLRGREGARVRAVYRENAREYGVEWKRRDYSPDSFDDSDLINQALSAANAALYGVTHSAIVGLGLSPGLGFVHESHDLSFVHDIADLYKAEISIPAAFATVAADPEDAVDAVRRRVRDRVFEEKTLQKAVRDMQILLGVKESEVEHIDADVVTLWDFRAGEIEGGRNYEEALLLMPEFEASRS